MVEDRALLQADSTSATATLSASGAWAAGLGPGDTENDLDSGRHTRNDGCPIHGEDPRLKVR
jgi:hypothetical protein